MTYAGLIVFFFLEYVRPTSYWPFLTALHLNSIVPLSTGALCLLTAGPATIARLLNAPNVRIVAAMLGLVWLSFLTADVQMQSWNVLTVILGFGLITWIIGSTVVTVRKLKGVIFALIGAHVVVAFLNPLLFTDPETRHYLTSGSFLGDGNDFALSIDIILPLCLFVLLDSRRAIVRIFWTLVILVLVAGVVVTQSRGGTIGLGCMAMYYWAKSQKKAQTGVIVAVAFALILALAPGNYFNRMRMISDTTEGSASARLTAWGIAIRMAIDNPLLGVGAGHFGVKIGNEYRPADFVGSGMTAHSVYFLALGELGLPGLVLLLFFIGFNLRANRSLALEVQTRGSPDAWTDLQLLSSLSASLIAFASAGAFLSVLYYPHLYVLAGILTAGRHVVRERLNGTAATAIVRSDKQSVAYHWALRPAPRRTPAFPMAPRAQSPAGPSARRGIR
jgi:probable O-glycosylation ligase (exosortase A-associated)